MYQHNKTSELYTVERVQTGVRIEKRLLKVMKALAEYHDMSLGDLIEGIVLHSFEGKHPFGAENLKRIPGPKAIQSYLARDPALQGHAAPLPQSTRTIWKVLRRHGRIGKDRAPSQSSDRGRCGAGIRGIVARPSRRDIRCRGSFQFLSD